MPSATTIPNASRFSAIAAKSTDAYRTLILEAAQGLEVDPDDALRVALAAGRSAIQLDADLRTATERYERDLAYHARDFDAEIATAMQEYRDAIAGATEAQALFEQAQEACREAHRRSEAAMSKRTRLAADKDAAGREYQKAMRETAGADRNANDWRNFQLS